MTVLDAIKIVALNAIEAEIDLDVLIKCTIVCKSWRNMLLGIDMESLLWRPLFVHNFGDNLLHFEMQHSEGVSCMNAILKYYPIAFRVSRMKFDASRVRQLAHFKKISDTEKNPLHKYQIQKIRITATRTDSSHSFFIATFKHLSSDWYSRAYQTIGSVFMDFDSKNPPDDTRTQQLDQFSQNSSQVMINWKSNKDATYQANHQKVFLVGKGTSLRLVEFMYYHYPKHERPHFRVWQYTPQTFTELLSEASNPELQHLHGNQRRNYREKIKQQRQNAESCFSDSFFSSSSVLQTNFRMTNCVASEGTKMHFVADNSGLCHFGGLLLPRWPRRIPSWADAEYFKRLRFRTLTIWDLTTCKEIASITVTGNFKQMNLRNLKVAIPLDLNTVLLYDAVTGESFELVDTLLQSIREEEKAQDSPPVSIDSQERQELEQVFLRSPSKCYLSDVYCVVGNTEGGITAYNVVTKTLHKRFRCHDEIFHMQVVGNLLFVACGSVEIFDLNKGTLVNKITLAGDVIDFVVAGTELFCVCASSQGTSSSLSVMRVSL